MRPTLLERVIAARASLRYAGVFSFPLSSVAEMLYRLTRQHDDGEERLDRDTSGLGVFSIHPRSATPMRWMAPPDDMAFFPLPQLEERIFAAFAPLTPFFQSSDEVP